MKKYSICHKSVNIRVSYASKPKILYHALNIIFSRYSIIDVNWGSSRQAQLYVETLKSTIDLMTVEDHIKNFRPQILVLSGLPSTRPSLVDFGQIITKNEALLVCGNIIQVIHTVHGQEHYLSLMLLNTGCFFYL